MDIRNKRIIVTGGLGFIGSNFIQLLSQTSTNILNIDNQSYSARNSNIIATKNYQFLKVSINNKKKVLEIFKLFKPHLIINFAAQTHVDRSIDSPDIFLKTNIFGLSNLLNASVNYWNSIKRKRDFLFLQISTDEVFGSLNFKDNPKKETDSFEPSSPYSSSKASADLLVKSWNKTYGLPTITVYPTNNFGPWQYPEKFIPLMILKTLLKKKLTIYGDGKNIREWIYVKDCAEAIISVINRGRIGESYNIGSGEQINNVDIAKYIVKKIDGEHKNFEDKIDFVKDRPAHDLRYNLDCTKIKLDTGWNAKYDFHEALSNTIDWYKANFKWLKKHTKSYGIFERIGKGIVD